MRRRSWLAVACAAAAIVAATARSANTAPVNACALLAAGVRTDHYWAINLTKHSYIATGGGGYRCELTSAPAAGSVTPAFGVVLTFFTSRTTALAHQNVALLQRKGATLPGTGADEAYASETHDAGGTSTRATWRRGRYWGWLAVTGPKLAGDRDDARDLLRAFVSRLP
jgi:hypothetical protein